MNLVVIILVAVGYMPGMLILLRLIAQLQKKLRVDRALEKAPKNKAALANIPKPVWPVWRERINFTMKDKRKKFGMENRIFFLVLLAAGFVVALAGAATSLWLLVLLGYLLFFIGIAFGVQVSKEVVETRKKVMQRMYEIGASKGLLSGAFEENPGAVQVLDWIDYVKPNKVEYQVRTEFSSAGEEAFLQQFNQIFGNETAWVPSDEKVTFYEDKEGKRLSDKQAKKMGEAKLEEAVKAKELKKMEQVLSGWNYDEAKVTLHAVPPLPQMAPWDEHYVLSEGIAWSFFPIALGVENGVELPNPKTGETEYILGFDLSGEQAKIGGKAGLKVSNNITTSPMVFVGGGTGGGKSLSSDTLVEVLDPEDL